MPTTRKEAGAAAGAGGPAEAAAETPQQAGAGADSSGLKEVVEAPPEPTRVKNLYDSADIKHQLDSVAVEVSGSRVEVLTQMPSMTATEESKTASAVGRGG